MRSILTSLALLLLACAPAQAQKRIALTFDDAPRQRGAFLTPDERTRRLIAGLRRAGVRQAAFFVNPGRLATADGRVGAAHIAAYVAAGHVIANHGFSHLKLSTLGVADYLADLDRAEEWLRPRAGYRPWFRYPFLDEGGPDKAKRDAVRAGLKARGMRSGYVTVDGSDWNLEQLAVDAQKAGKRIDRKALRDLYVETMVQAADYYDALAVRTDGRSPAHVMLLHETDLAALYVTDLVKALRRDGWRIVTADEAYADPIADEAMRYDTPSAQGSLTEMLAWQKGLPAPRWYERNTLSIANPIFARRVLHEEPVR